MTVYSNSRLNTFETCPLQYKFRYIDKIKSDFESIEAFLGKRFHEVMEALYGELRYRVRSLNELLDLFDAQWKGQMHPAVTVVKKNKTAEDYKQLGLEAIRKYYERYYPFNQSRTLGLELRVDVNLSQDGNYRMMGYVDRLSQSEDGTFEIHDYKTSQSEPEQEDLDADRQLALYQMAIQTNWPEARNVRLIWHYVALDQEFLSTRSPGQLEGLKIQAMQLIDRIEGTREFPPRESRLCDWCAYQQVCPVKRKPSARTDVQISFTDTEGEEKKQVDSLVALILKKGKLAEEIGTIQQQIQDLSRKAVQFAESEAKDRLTGSSYLLKISEEMRIYFPPEGSEAWETLEEQLKESKLWETVARVDRSSLEKLLVAGQMEDETLRTIEPHCRRELRKTFSLCKKEEEVHTELDCDSEVANGRKG